MLNYTFRSFGCVEQGIGVSNKSTLKENLYFGIHKLYFLGKEFKKAACVSVCVQSTTLFHTLGVLHSSGSLSWLEISMHINFTLKRSLFLRMCMLFGTCSGGVTVSQRTMIKGTVCSSECKRLML